ncbi:MAG: hypothetical protein R8K20_10920 [Gallionellaceae bacterium]
MEQLQSFSPGLLYSIAPENFSQLHLDEDAAIDEFDWDEHEAERVGDSFAKIIYSFLKVTAIKWGIGKP